MTILITGAGLIATHSAVSLIDRGEDVVFYDVAPDQTYIDLVLEGRQYALVKGDILDLAHLLEVAKQHNVSGIVHTAAFLPRQAAANPSLTTRVNVEGAVNLFEVHRIAGLKRTVFVSTVGVYDQNVKDGRPWREDHALGPHSYYGCTKLSAEMMGLHYANAYGVDLVSVRFCPIFGIGQYYGSSGAVFMKNVVEPSALTGKSVVTEPFPNTYQYLYAPDSGDAVALAYKIKHNPKNRVFHVSEGRLRTAKELIKIAEAALPGSEISIAPKAWMASKGRNEVSEAFNIGRAKRELAFKSQYTMRQAIQHYAGKVRERGYID
jgi:nucleoside-diphosphate-sugar epimerase